MILLLDNYDSFVFNLARYFEQLGQAVHVVRNDAIDAAGVRELRPAALVLSPGPCTPREAGVSLELIRELHGELPILGVCLGHQAIGEAFGGQTVRGVRPMHGRASRIQLSDDPLFDGLDNPLQVGRYHSLVIEPATLPDALQVISRTPAGTIMAVRHRELPVYGVQFHPESVLTHGGHRLLANFLRIAGVPVPVPLPTHDAEVSQPVEMQYELPLSPVTF